MGMDRKIIQRWLNGELSPGEEAAWLRVMETATEEDIAALFPEEEWEHTPPMLVDARRQRRSLRGIHAATGAAEAPRWKRNAVRAACVAGLLVLGGYLISQPRLNRMVAEAKDRKTIFTADGVKKMITLPDGTRISLNGGSEVDIPEAFTEDVREVRLVKGEIFLDVEQDEQRPFIVTAGKVKIQVLGTSFNVRGYSEEQRTVVTVKTGKVSVHASQGGREIVLTPGVQVAFDDRKAAFSQAVLKETGMIGGWKNNELAYENEQLKDVFRDLAYNYGLHFEVRDSAVLHKHVNAIFIKRSQEDIIRILGKMADFKYKVSNKDIIIY